MRRAGGQSGGSQRIVLPSQPVCNLSHSRNRWRKKDCGEKRGGGSGGKRTVTCFLFFFTETVTDEESI